MTMASERYKCNAKLSTINIKDGGEIVKKEAPEIIPFSKYGNEQNPSGNQFGDGYMLKEEILEEPTETKSFSEYEVFNELEKNISTYSNTWDDNSNISGPAGELAKLKIKHFNNEVILSNEDSECIDDPSTNNVESKMVTLKTEDDNDIIYEDVKLEICEEKLGGKSENQPYQNSFPDVLIGREFGPNFPIKLSIESGARLQQNTAIEENESAMKRDNDTRKEPIIKCNAKIHQEVQERTHTVEKLFQCKICPRSFSVKSNLCAHRKIHTGEKPFQCKFCPKSFTVKYNSLVHERTHTGERPFQCEICPKRFALKSNLMNHARGHAGERPFKCKICPKSFSVKSHLVVHGRSHTGEKPFQCNICPKSFTVKSNLLVHERTHTGEKPYQCKFCSKSFTQKQNFTIHQRIHEK